MKIKEGLQIRNMAGENVLIMQGRIGADMTKVVSFNSSALWLWNHFQHKEFEEEDVILALINEYKIDREPAERDAQYWINQLHNCNAFEL